VPKGQEEKRLKMKEKSSGRHLVSVSIYLNQNERIVILSDINARVGYVEVEEGIHKFGVPGVNWAGRNGAALYKGWSNGGRHVFQEEVSR
jgi:hypothetical protein